MNEHGREPESREVDDFDQLYPGRFLKGGDLSKGPATYTITWTGTEDLETAKGIEEKPVIRFGETKKGWIPCKTAGICLRRMFGRSPREWKGKRVTLYFDPTIKFGRETTGGIRVKGSPDITAALDVEVKLSRRTSIVHLEVTGRPAQQTQAPKPPADVRGKWITACAKLNYDADTAVSWAHDLGVDLNGPVTPDQLAVMKAALESAGGKAE